MPETIKIENNVAPVAAVGLCIPVSANPNPVEGTLYFNTSTNKLLIYNGTAWKEIQLI